MPARIALAPVSGVHDPRFAVQVGEIPPGVVAALDFGLVSPVVVGSAVGGVVDGADLGLAGVSLVVAREPLPGIRLAWLAAEDVPQDGLRRSEERRVGKECR